MSTKIRVAPSKSLLRWRKGFLERLKEIKPVRPSRWDAIGLSIGNTKIGKTGKLYKTVFVWNLPSVATCPGASDWCLSHCYNADSRESVFPIREWVENWWMIINQPEYLRSNIINQLSKAERPCAVRIHSSGDFFSKAYIEFWIDLVCSTEDTTFWSYTRSWTCSDLLPYLNRLRSIKNLQLFASWDITMKYNPPKGWRRSYVYVDAEAMSKHSQSNSEALICPEQIGRVDSCASCGFCLKHRNKDILFYFH